MTLLNTANRLYRGTALIDNACVGSTMVWPILNPAFAVFGATSSSNVRLSGGGLCVTSTTSGVTSSGARPVEASGKTSGKFYYEWLFNTIVAGGTVGMAGVGTNLSTFAEMQNNGTTGIMVHNNGQIWSVGGIPTVLPSFAVGNRGAIAADMDHRTFWARKLPSGFWNADSSADPATNVGGITIPPGIILPYCTFGAVSHAAGDMVKTNFGQYVFTAVPPSGFTPGWSV